jgi:hypothetical protein
LSPAESEPIVDRVMALLRRDRAQNP